MNKLRKTIGVIVVCLAAVLGLFISNASAVEFQVVKVGVFDSIGYYGTDGDGTPNSYGYAYLEEISKISSLRFEFVKDTFANCLEMLENGKIDVLDAVQYSHEREERFLYSKYSTGTSFCKVLARDDDRLAYNDFDAFNGKNVGVIRGSSRNLSFRDFAKKHKFSVREVFFDDSSDMKEALKNGGIDMMVIGNISNTPCEKIIARFAPQSSYMITNKNNSALMEQLNEALEQIQVMKPSFNNDLYRRYFSNECSHIPLTDSEIKYIESRRPIRVVYDSNWAPFESYSPSEKSPAGINYEVLKLIAEKTKLNFNFVDGKTYEEALNMVIKGEVDMLMSYDTNPDFARDSGIMLSDTFMETPIAIIGEDYEISEKKVFAISKMHPMILSYVKNNFPNNKVIIMPDINECYEAVKRGDADLTAENIYAANLVIQSGEYGTLRVASVTSLTDKFSFAFKKDTDFLLISIFNKAISTISALEKERLLLSSNVNAGTHDWFSNLMRRYRFEFMLAVNLLVLTVVISLCAIIFQQSRSRNALWKMAYVDPLTNLPNLKKFKLDAMKLLSENPDIKYAIAILDINKFNLINEIFGFHEGDRVLLLLKEALLGTLNRKTDLLARILADKFIFMIASDPLNEDGSIYHADYDGFSKFMSDKMPHMIRFSIGRYFINPGESDMDAIFEKVNYAHNMAKQNSALNEIYDYDDDMKKQAIRHREIESGMEAALKNNEFIVYLQPKFNLEDMMLAGAEALARWQEEEGKEVVYPSEFIPLFEKNGFIVKLDMYMFDKVCQLINKWIEQKLPLTTISVNFSRLHLSNPNFVQEIIDIAKRYDVPRRYLEIELTESAMFGNETVLESVLAQLHHAGFTLSMDDFGTGYSSLGLLKNLPVDVIKIDRAFFTNNRYKTRAKTVIESVIAMAKELGIHTVAEGVETHEHVDFLREIGCESVQGYYFARPMPADEFQTQSINEHPDVQETEYDLNLDKLGKIDFGRETLGNNMPVIIYRLFDFSLREVLALTYGEGEMEDIIRSAGKIAGRVFARELLNLSLPFEEFIKELVVKLLDMKIGILKAETLSSENGSVIFTISDDIECSGMQNCGKSVCKYDEGFIAGLLYEYTKKPYSVVEVDCWGTGAQLCRFEAKPR